MHQSIVFFLLSALIGGGLGARILGVVHVAFYSHYQFGESFYAALARRGHDVTLVTPFNKKTHVKNLKRVVLTGEFENAKEATVDLFGQPNINVFKKIVLYESVAYRMTERTLKHPNVRKLLNSDKKFDLVIIYNFRNEAFHGFCYHYKTPCIVLSPMPMPYITHDRVGSPDNPAYFPDNYLISSKETNFYHRLYNSFIYTAIKLFNHVYAFPKQNNLMQKYFNNTPHLSTLYYNTSLVLVNSHISMNPALPFVPNIIQIAGCHVNPPKQLPAELKKYLDSAKNGVIFFSLGSILKSKELPNQKREALLKAFSKLEQKVLWKWEDTELPGKPDNVNVSKWFPQQDILGHPNIKLFITHGGLLSITEAIYHGVPIIGIPIFADQYRNVYLAENAGYGLGVPLESLTEETFTLALKEMLSNPMYSQNAKRRSSIMHDEPFKPLDRAIFWIEYVMRHQGAPHLRSAALNLAWYQYLLLDVLAVVTIAIVVPTVILLKTTKKFFYNGTVQKIGQKKKKS